MTRNAGYFAYAPHVIGRGAAARNRAIEAMLRTDLAGVHFTHTPRYSPFIRTGVARYGAGTQIGKNAFASRRTLMDTLIHEELHHRWWARGNFGEHHATGYVPDEYFYRVVERFLRMKGL